VTKKEKKNFAQLPVGIQKKLTVKDPTPIIQQKLRIVLAYSSHVKLKAVVRWKERMAKAGLNNKKIAEHLDVPETRISEWLNFTWEPQEDIFLKVEKLLYKHGA